MGLRWGGEGGGDGALCRYRFRQRLRWVEKPILACVAPPTDLWAVFCLIDFGKSPCDDYHLHAVWVLVHTILAQRVVLS